MIPALLPFLLIAGTKSPPSFAGLQSSVENSSLTMECKGAAPFNEIRCEFREVAIRIPDEDEVQKKVAESKSVVSKVSDKKLAESKKALCAALPSWKKDKAGTLARRRALAEDVAFLERMCGCQDRACALNEMLKHDEANARTCEVYGNHYDLTLRRTDSRTWVANEGPSGQCGVIEVFTLEADSSEADSKEDYSLWAFTLVRASANKSSELCVGLQQQVNKPMVWTWKEGAHAELVADCRRFKLSLAF
jgi:hypothetical protein